VELRKYFLIFSNYFRELLLNPAARSVLQRNEIPVIDYFCYVQYRSFVSGKYNFIASRLVYRRNSFSQNHASYIIFLRRIFYASRDSLRDQRQKQNHYQVNLRRSVPRRKQRKAQKNYN